ncbi:MAG: hypothetical protein ACKOGA_05980 [Planctomycetaceae bacterium]
MNVADELQRLLGLFPGSEDLVSRYEHIPAALTPEPYKSLLVHEHHMTLTMERFHGSPVRVRVLNRRFVDNLYARHIVLEREDTGAVVQFGIVRFDLSFVTAAVREEILSERIPLGRTLINFNVLRHIDLGAILQIWPGPALRTLLGGSADLPVYGRLATIFCNRHPAVDLLEIAAPVAAEGTPEGVAGLQRLAAGSGPVAIRGASASGVTSSSSERAPSAKE